MNQTVKKKCEKEKWNTLTYAEKAEKRYGWKQIDCKHKRPSIEEIKAYAAKEFLL